MSFNRLIQSAILLLSLAVIALPVHAREWTVSPHRAQLASDENLSQAPADETSQPSIPGKKNIGRGVMFSLVVPGTGQLYAGSWLRAIPWFAIEVAGWAMFAKYHGDGQDKTDEFEKFAGPWKNDDAASGNFNYDAYMLREYQISRDLTYNTAQYDGDLSEWVEETWETRHEYLSNAPGFGHDINNPDIQQYYEMIGKYYDQFGFGWVDTYDGDPTNPDAGYIWGPSGDEIATVWFDGESPFFYSYRDMRGEANDMLEKGNVMMEIVMVNHILSALDAALAVRTHNKKLQSTLGSLDLRYEIKNRDGAMARTMTLGIPLPSLFR